MAGKHVTFTSTSLYLIEGAGVHKEQALVWFEGMVGDEARFYLVNAHGTFHSHNLDIKPSEVTVLAEWRAKEKP